MFHNRGALYSRVLRFNAGFHQVPDCVVFHNEKFKQSIETSAEEKTSNEKHDYFLV